MISSTLVLSRAGAVEWTTSFSVDVGVAWLWIFECWGSWESGSMGFSVCCDARRIRRCENRVLGRRTGMAGSVVSMLEWSAGCGAGVSSVVVLLRMVAALRRFLKGHKGIA